MSVIVESYNHSVIPTKFVSPPPPPPDRNKKFLIYHVFSICNRSASGIVPFESDATVFCRSTAFQNALDHENQTITTKVTLCLLITTIHARLVISVFFSFVIDHDPPTQIHRYYGMILTFDNYGRPLTWCLDLCYFHQGPITGLR